jgi:hypothetical protein
VWPPPPKEREKKKRKGKARGPKCHSFYGRMTRGEASLALAIRTEKVGLNAYLTTRRVPGYAPGYNLTGCEHTSQTAKHVIMYCPSLETKRWEEGGLMDKCGTNDYHQITSSRWRMREAAIWLMRTDLLPQYSLAKEMIGILPRDEPKTLT